MDDLSLTIILVRRWHLTHTHCHHPLGVPESVGVASPYQAHNHGENFQFVLRDYLTTRHLKNTPSPSLRAERSNLTRNSL
jgi:hypothetical protein